MAQKTTEAIVVLRYPTATYQMRLFFGLDNVFRRFVPGFARIAALLNKRLKMGQQSEFDLDEKERATVDELKERLTSPTILTLARSAGQYTVDPEASDC